MGTKMGNLRGKQESGNIKVLGVGPSPWMPPEVLNRGHRSEVLCVRE